MIFYFFLAGALQYNPFAAAKSVAGISVPKIFLIPSLVIQTWSFYRYGLRTPVNGGPGGGSERSAGFQEVR